MTSDLRASFRRLTDRTDAPVTASASRDFVDALSDAQAKNEVAEAIAATGKGVVAVLYAMVELELRLNALEEESASKGKGSKGKGSKGKGSKGKGGA